MPFILNSANSLLDKIGESGQINPETNEIVTGGSSLAESMEKLKSSTGSLVIDFVDWGSVVIAMLFVLGVVMMLTSIIFRNGQWQKWGQGTMLMSFIALLAIRAIPIVILSFRSGDDINDALHGGLTALSQIAFFLCIVGILLSFLFRFAHSLIKHPDYHRWSKNIMNVSVIMIFISLLGPYIFKF